MTFLTAIYRERSLGGSHANETIPWRMKNPTIKENYSKHRFVKYNYAEQKRCDSLKWNKNYKESNISPSASP